MSSHGNRHPLSVSFFNAPGKFETESGRSTAIERRLGFTTAHLNDSSRSRIARWSKTREGSEAFGVPLSTSSPQLWLVTFERVNRSMRTAPCGCGRSPPSTTRCLKRLMFHI
ncbi:sulfite reductase hemoprotein beta-component [Striga asiatica]|uniref:Sulfite reductase hemoprotein beta-component n=1 Tax=Striga asiatica TaxID=4170 RepID=A0A5A7PN26_STRAF|nr:sulfite reductase hemoprotein beta-component [Striga asiatica]GER34180.1 sulfite reductase hemoprotein beta-component [Striga asiatica]